MKISILSSFEPWRGATAATGVGLLIAIFTAALGVWQWNRAYDKETLLSEAQQRAEGLPLLAPGRSPRFDEGLAPVDLNQRKARLKGRWLPETTLYLDNRLHEGRAGIQVVTAMILEDGSIAWVNRGWAMKPPGLSGPDTLALTRGDLHRPAADIDVSLEAIALTDLMRRMELASQPEMLRQGALWQNLEWSALRARLVERVPAEPASGLAVWPAIFWQTSAENSLQAPLVTDPLIRSLPQVKADDVSKHRGYAIQWWLMSLVALAFAWRLRTRPPRPEMTDNRTQ